MSEHGQPEREPDRGPSAIEAVAPIEAVVRAAIERAGDVASLDAALAEGMGRQSPLAELQRSLSARPPSERGEWGRALQAARAAIDSAASARRAELARAERQARVFTERMDLTEIRAGYGPGHAHLISQTWEALEDIFIGMGFTVAEGPEVEDDWHNFEALNMAPGHPARDAQDSFYVDLGSPGSTVLRTHTSPVQIRVMETTPPPIWTVSPGRVYRRDTPDASHLPAFHQIEALVVDEGICFGDLAGTIDTFTKAFFGPQVRSRLRPAFFPFTEPSAEFDVSCTVCGGEGCRTCGGVGWLELGGSGMVDPAVFEAVGLDPERYSGFAFGFGIDRCAIMRWKVSDLRLFTDNDVRFLSQF